MSKRRRTPELTAIHRQRWLEDIRAAHLRLKQRQIVARMEALRKERAA